MFKRYKIYESIAMSRKGSNYMRCGRYIREDLMSSYFQCGLEREDNLQWSNSKEGIRKGEITCIKHIMLFHFAREN